MVWSYCTQNKYMKTEWIYVEEGEDQKIGG